MEDLKPIIKRLHNIHTFSCQHGRDVVLIGKDEYGQEFHLTLDAYEVLEIVDMGYIKENFKKHIDSL